MEFGLLAMAKTMAEAETKAKNKIIKPILVSNRQSKNCSVILEYEFTQLPFQGLKVLELKRPKKHN
jgi:hypothetical protein